MNQQLLKLLNQKEVASIVRKSEAWLERKRWEGGGIAYRKIGRHVLYSENDVMDWLESHPRQVSTADDKRMGDR